MACGGLTEQEVLALIAGSGATAFANPSGAIGLAPVNGVAATALRSDGHPALDQAISPVWTGFHRFTKKLIYEDNGGIGIRCTPTGPFSNVISPTGAVSGATAGVNNVLKDGNCFTFEGLAEFTGNANSRFQATFNTVATGATDCFDSAAGAYTGICHYRGMWLRKVNDLVGFCSVWGLTFANPQTQKIVVPGYFPTDGTDTLGISADFGKLYVGQFGFSNTVP